MTKDILEAYKQIKGKKTKILDEQLKPVKSLLQMSEYTAMLSKENVLTVKNARPFTFETRDEDEDDEENERDTEPEDAEDRAERKEKVQSIKRRLSGSPRGVRQEDVISAQDLANKPQPLANKPKKRKKVVEDDTDDYSIEDLPRLKAMLREPKSPEEVETLIDAIVQLKLREILADMNDGEMDEGYMPVAPLPLMESVGNKTEWIKKLLEVRVQ